VAAASEHVVGIDGYPAGWVAAMWTGGRITWATAAVAGIDALCPADAVTGIDMPLGLLDRGLRECDALARHELVGAASRVFTTPPRAVLELGPRAPNDRAQRLSRELTGQGVSRQALELGPRILALDAVFRAHPERRIIEVHPELSFAAMTGSVLDGKKSARGVGQRLAALASWLPDVAAVVGTAPVGVPIDDALDALAALWSARRLAVGTAYTLPADPAPGTAHMTI
jgi:predicted RNase H-like nuclease